MLRQLKAKVPLLYDLAHRSKHASEYVENSTTVFQKKAFIIELDGVNSQLVSEAIKLGQSVMSSLGKNKSKDELLDILEDPEKGNLEEGNTREVTAMPLSKALLTGAGVAAVPALAANYTLDRASDDFDAKMLAIPGLAAATVGAVLAARAAGNSDSSKDTKKPAKELETAINAKEVLDKAMESTEDPNTYEELSKMSSVSTDHIASLITELLF